MFMSMTSELVNSAKYTRTSRSSGSSDVTSNSTTYKDPNSGSYAGSGTGFNGYGFSSHWVGGCSWGSAGTVGNNQFSGLSLGANINYGVYGTKGKDK